ncbi:uncharacterized protein LOC136085707 [Hydra vulgaris]|uniref:Uncharacterized protein LOC136085707 n=1 Tax=Hydra vulgaris TaxID=6087 RepID=A0ABM4CMQ1_HYDVU
MKQKTFRKILNLDEKDYEKVEQVTEKAREIMFIRSKERLFKKFNILQNEFKNKQKIKNGKLTTHTKNAVLNLCSTKIPNNQNDLLNLGPNFVPSLKHIPYMDIIATTESFALKLEYNNIIENAQDLKKNVLKELKMEYDSIYPSDPIPPRMYGLIKAHKPEKAYPMRIVVSTISTPNYGISNYLVKAIKPILNKTRLTNSFDFVSKANSWNVDENEVQVSFDVINLYPSIPLKEATLILIDQLNKGDYYRCSTKLTISETKTLIELCLHRCYFLWNNEIHELENSVPIGLSFMVVLTESFLQHHEENAFKIAMTLNLPLDLKSYLRYDDDSHTRFSNI